MQVFDLQKTHDNRFSIEQGNIANHHFCRVTVDVGRWIQDEKKKTSTYVVEEIVGEGVAKRSHKDRKDDYVGKTLALSRALESLAHKVEKRALGKVKHNDDMKVQRAVKKAERREQLAVAAREVRIVPVEVKNAEVVGEAFQRMFGDTHFEDSIEETERLIDEC